MVHVRFDQHPDHLEVVYTGTVDFDEIEDLVRSMADHADSGGYKCVLLDIIGSTGDVSVTDRYRVGELMARIWDRPVKLSVLVREEHLLPDRFWVTVTQNRGLSTSVFTERGSALDWLLG